MNTARSIIITEQVEATKPVRDTLESCRPMAKALFHKEVELGIRSISEIFEHLYIIGDMLTDKDYVISNKQYLEDVFNIWGKQRADNGFDIKLDAWTKTVEDACLAQLGSTNQSKVF